MFDFLNSNLTPKVVCSSPATDSYEVENLISSTFADKLRGFIAYPAIKPPVEIEFEFICPVNIHYISLNTSVGSQKSTGIEIFAKNKELEYTSICRASFDAPGIIFGNGRKYSKTNLPENCNRSFEFRTFRSNTFNLFLDASRVKVVIFRTDKSVPCLGSVEVWGIPSKSCSRVTVDIITKLAKRTATSSTTKLAVQEIGQINIPDDFKDDLTCEIMSLPMTLPSGKSIDRSTLEKHVRGEESFGRKPCDPFTGVKFTDKLKPVLNVALKSRIDMFVLQHSHREEFVHLKRTLGGSRITKRRRNSSDENVAKEDPLEESIAKAKRNSNFVSFTTDTVSKSECVKCKIELNSLYKISCDHFYCRNCLLEVREISKCGICDTAFTSGQVEKVNF